MTAWPPMSMSTFRSTAAAGIDAVSPFVAALKTPVNSFAEPSHAERNDILFLGSGGLRSRGLLCVALLEAVNASRGVNELLFAGEERVALRADLDAQLLLRRSGRPRLAAGTMDLDLMILRLDLCFHELTSGVSVA